MGLGHNEMVSLGKEMVKVVCIGYNPCMIEQYLV